MSEKILKISILVCAFLLVVYLSFPFMRDSVSSVVIPDDLSAIQCPYRYEDLSNKELVALPGKISMPSDLRNRITADKTACFLDEAINRDIIPANAALFVSAFNLFDGPVHRNYRKAAYFYNRIIENDPYAAATVAFVKNRQAGFYASGKGGLPRDREKAMRLMKASAFYLFRQVRLLDQCRDEVAYKNTYPLYIWHLDTPWLIIETQSWMKTLCSMSREETEALATEYLGGTNSLAE